MAKSFWPGPSFRPRTDFRTGEGEVFRQLGNLAATGGDIAVKLYVQQAQDQFSTAQIQTKQAEADYAASLSKELDESKYPGMLKKYEASIKEFRPKNPLAAHDFDGYIANKSVEWGKANTQAMEDRLLDKWEVKADILEKEFIETGDEIAYVEHMGKGVQLHGQDESQSLRRVEAARGKADRRIWLDTAKSRPEELLDSVKTVDGKERIGLLPGLTDPGVILEIKNIAKGSIADQIIEKGRLSIETQARLSEAAADPNTDVGEYQIKIQQSDGLTDEQKINAMDKFVKSRRIMAAGGDNSYTRTQNWTLYSNHRERAAKRTITEQEIMDNVGPGGYSWPEAERLLKIISGESSSSKAFEESAAAKNLTAQIKAMLPVTGTTIDRTDVALNQFATQRGLGLLEDAIQRNPDWTDREKKEEALRIGRQLEREYDNGTLELSMERALEMTTEELAKEIERDLNKISLSEIRRFGIPRPRTKAEYDALPKGTTYIHPTLGRVVKQ